MTAPAQRFRQLDPAKIIQTVEALERRIGERFPDSSLRTVAQELVSIATEAAERNADIRRPHVFLRAVTLLLVAGLAGLLIVLALSLNKLGRVESTLEFIQVLEPGLGALFFLGAIFVFLLSIEIRTKRSRALRAIHELRSIAHVIDMHQLTKDPERLGGSGPSTASSPKRELSPFLLGRYFDYCSEMLSLTSKVSALYVQGFDDSTAVSAVDEIENLTTGLSRKIWQKIIILDRQVAEGRAL